MACDSVIELYAASEAVASRAAAAAVAEVQRIERKYSRYLADSVVSTINNSKVVEGRGVWSKIDSETAHLLDFADSCYRQSEGLFDITAGVLRRVWDFNASAPPTPSMIATVLPLIGWTQLERTADAVRFTVAGMEIDFGGFGKEYAADRAAAVLLSHGVANGYVDLGGDVVIIGPQADGSAWSLGIRHPRHANAVLETLNITSGAVATSGDYERFLIHNGVRYSHILNPFTGRSVHGMQSVTAFASTCMVAGALTTIAMLKGEGGLAWLGRSGSRALAIGADGAAHHYP